MDRFHLAIDVIDRLPDAGGSEGAYLKQELQDKLVEHRHYVTENGVDMPEVRDWKWDL
jgi:xylulose-5-phosphate/fructose-6-phosphate phosphoketolase